MDDAQRSTAAAKHCCFNYSNFHLAGNAAKSCCFLLHATSAGFFKATSVASAEMDCCDVSSQSKPLRTLECEAEPEHALRPSDDRHLDIQPFRRYQGRACRHVAM
jgi:hypothetical protein